MPAAVGARRGAAIAAMLFALLPAACAPADRRGSETESSTTDDAPRPPSLAERATARANDPPTGEPSSTSPGETPDAMGLKPPPGHGPKQARAPDDLPPCPGINPDIRRPKGSNCLGIVPAACGADRARGFIGRPADAPTRAALSATVGHERIRWIAPDEAVTDDLVSSRLNVLLDRRGRIDELDCH